MRSALKRRPSPAMVVGVLALVVAMAGTSFAAFKVRSGNIVDGTVRPVDIRKNSLTGDQLRENKIGTVPSAQQAQVANSLSTPAAAPLKTRWLLLNEKGQIEEQSGGFTVLDAYVTNQNVYVDTGASLVGHGLSATIAIQNKVDTSGDGMADPNFAGQVSVARCQTPAVECAPPSAKTVNALVVSPRAADGGVTEGTGMNPRKRVYVEVTG